MEAVEFQSWCKSLVVIDAILLTKSSGNKACLKPFRDTILIVFDCKYPSTANRLSAFCCTLVF